MGRDLSDDSDGRQAGAEDMARKIHDQQAQTWCRWITAEEHTQAVWPP